MVQTVAQRQRVPRTALVGQSVKGSAGGVFPGRADLEASLSVLELHLLIRAVPRLAPRPDPLKDPQRLTAQHAQTIGNTPDIFDTRPAPRSPRYFHHRTAVDQRTRLAQPIRTIWWCDAFGLLSG